jgi:hypothetical protein
LQPVLLKCLFSYVFFSSLLIQLTIHSTRALTKLTRYSELSTENHQSRRHLSRRRVLFETGLLPIFLRASHPMLTLTRQCLGHR